MGMENEQDRCDALARMVMQHMRSVLGNGGYDRATLAGIVVGLYLSVLNRQPATRGESLSVGISMHTMQTALQKTLREMDEGWSDLYEVLLLVARAMQGYWAVEHVEEYLDECIEQAKADESPYVNNNTGDHTTGQGKAECDPITPGATEGGGDATVRQERGDDGEYPSYPSEFGGSD